MNVIILPEILEYLDDLVFILFEKGYFNYLETSQRYVDELFDDINTTLPVRSKKPAPKRFDRYGKGMYYASFIKNKHTTWYVFFKMYKVNEELVYQVRYIANNHTIAKHLEHFSS